MTVSAEKKAIAVARKTLVTAVVAARKKSFSKEGLDYLLPYPLFSVDAPSRTVVIANAISVHVTKGGRLVTKALRKDIPDGFRMSVPIDSLAISWCQAIDRQYRRLLMQAISPNRECPPGWEQVRSAIISLYELKDLDPEVTYTWLNFRCPFSSARMAGIKKIAAVSRLIKIEVGKMIESLPGPQMMKNSFFWWGPVKVLEPKVWNRLVSLAPIVQQIKVENKRLAAPFIWLNLKHWLEGKTKHCPHWASIAPKEAVSMWRADLMKNGLTPGGWRWITHLSGPQLMALVNGMREDCSFVIQIINHIVAKQLPAQNVIKRWVGQYKCSWALDTPTTIAFFDAMIWYQYRHRNCKDIQLDIGNQVEDILDYLRGVEKECPPHLEEFLAPLGLEWPAPSFVSEGRELIAPKGVSFEWFLRKSEAWHYKMQVVWVQRREIELLIQEYVNNNRDEAGRLIYEARNRMVWDSLLKTGIYSGFDVVALTSGLDLVEEGVAMRHCVSGYANVCAIHGHRIFSIRKNGHRLATMEIAPVRAAYEVSQVRGKCNARVSAELTQLAENIAVTYSRLSRESSHVYQRNEACCSPV